MWTIIFHAVILCPLIYLISYMKNQFNLVMQRSHSAPLIILIELWCTFLFHWHFLKLRWPGLVAIFRYRFNPTSCISQQLLSNLTCVNTLNWKVGIWWLTVPLATHLYQLSACRGININETVLWIDVLRVEIKWTVWICEGSVLVYRIYFQREQIKQIHSA